MKNLLFGIAVGIPVGMLLAETLAGVRARDPERLIRDDIRTDLRGASAGLATAEIVDRVAADAREGRDRERETAVLNHVTRDELLAVPGIGPVLAQRILDGRPYRYDEEVVERKILNSANFDQLYRDVIRKHERSA